MTTVLVPIAEGSEEMEAVIVIDTLRRAKWDVTVAGLGPSPIAMSRGVKIVADVEWSAVDPLAYDILVVPGGAGGVAAMRRNARLLKAIRAASEAGRRVCAVCAGPLVLQDAGILDGRAATCHPGVVAEFTRARFSDQAVVVDGAIITSRGAGTSVAFALTIIADVEGHEKAVAVARGMVAPMP